MLIINFMELFYCVCYKILFWKFKILKYKEVWLLMRSIFGLEGEGLFGLNEIVIDN